MTETNVLECPKCGAALTPKPGATTARCEFCGTTVELGAGSPPPPPRVSVTVSSTQVNSKAAVRRLVIVMAGVGVLMAAGAAFMVASTGRGGAPHGSRVHFATGSQIPRDGQGRMIQWDDLAPVDFGDAGGHAVLLGLTRHLGHGKTDVIASAYDPTTLKPLWETRSLGVWEDYQAIHARIAGGRVVVTDSHGRVIVKDLGTGKTLRASFLPDQVKAFCVLDPGRPQVWAKTADGSGHLIDVSTGKTTNASRPKACPTGCEGRPVFAMGPECNHRGLAPKDLEINPSTVVLGGDAAVAFGDRRKGTQVPMAVGFDPATGTVKWKRTLPASDPFAARADDAPGIAAFGEGAAYVVVDMKTGGPRLFAIDAATGRTRWSVEVPREDSSMSEGKLVYHGHRLFLAHQVALDVLDANTGKLIGTLGET